MALDLAVTLRARDEATQTIGNFGRALTEAARAQLQMAEASQQMGRDLAQATRAGRMMGGVLLAELNPALGQMAMATSMATAATKGLGLGFTVISAALAIAVTGLVLFIRSTKEAEQSQERFNEALRTADPGLVTAKLKELTAELKALEAAQARIGGMGGPTMRTMLGDLGALHARTEEQIRQLFVARRVREEVEALAKSVGEIELAGILDQTAVQRAILEAAATQAKQFADALKFVAASIGEVELAGLTDDVQVFRLVQLDAAEAAKKFAEELRFVAESVGEVELAGLVDEHMIARLVRAQELERERLTVSADQLRVNAALRAAVTEGERDQLRLLDIELRRRQELIGVTDAQKIALANLQAQLEHQIVLQERLAREDPLEGLRLGVQAVGEEWTRVGELMQSGARRTGQDMARGLSVSFFSVVTGEFKKLSELPRQFGAALLRTMTDTAAQLITGAVFRQLGGAFGLREVGVLGLSAAAGTAGAVVNPQQAQALQAAGIPVGLSSTGQFVVTGAGGTGAGGGAGGFNLPTPPLSLGQNLLPTGVQTFMNTPLFAYGATAGALGGGAAFTSSAAGLSYAAALDIAYGGTGALGATGAFTVGSALGAAGGALGLGLTIFAALQGPPTATNIATSAVSGAISGAVLGSAVPGVGTVIGAIAGGILGGGAAAFGKGGGKQKGPSTREKSRAEGLAAASAFQSALRGVTTLEGLIPVLNAQYAPHPPRQWTIAATRSDGSNIRTGMFVAGSGPLFGFTLEDLFDPAVIDSMEVIAGEHGLEEQQPQIAQEIVQKIQELAAERAQVGVTTREFLGDGLFRETTVPGTLAKRLRGGQLVVEAGTIAGMEEADRVSMLRELAKLDYDQSLGILWRDPDTGEAVSLTTFLG